MVGGAQVSLLVDGGPNNGMTIPLSGRPITFGRRQDNDVVVEETTVSRRHALILETSSGYVLRDLNSTNGSFINRIKVGLGEHPLKHSDRIVLAGSNVAFVFQQEPDDTKPIKVEGPTTGAIQLQGELAEEAAGPAEPASAEPGSKDQQLLSHLQSNQGSPVSREDIARAVWPEAPTAADANREIDAAIERLRETLEDNPANPVHVITVGEFGYMYI